MISYSYAKCDYFSVAHKGGSVSLMTIQKDNFWLLCGIVMSSSLDDLCSNLSLKVSSKSFSIVFVFENFETYGVSWEELRELAKDVARFDTCFIHSR